MRIPVEDHLLRATLDASGDLVESEEW